MSWKITIEINARIFIKGFNEYDDNNIGATKDGIEEGYIQLVGMIKRVKEGDVDPNQL